jgi:hypothetical protein
MLTATEARTENFNSKTYETEIYLINLNILDAISTGYMIATIGASTVTTVMGTEITGTTMTTSETYYKVWQNTIVDPQKNGEMNKVIDYFTKLGYTISRKSDDGTYLFWQVSW